MFSFTRRPCQHQRQQQRRDRTSSNEYIPPANTAGETKVSAAARDVQKSSTEKSITTTKPSSEWRTAICPKTKKTYYWNITTRESRWKKPLELVSETERSEIEKNERIQKEFFEEMEQNILRRLSSAKTKSGVGSGSGSMFESGSGGMVFGKSTMKDMASISPGTADTAEISESWTQPSSSCEGSLYSANGGNNDWIQGWISADSSSVLSSSSSLEESPGSGRSDDAMNGISDTVRMESFSPTFSIESKLSRDSSLLYEEERNDKVLPLVKKSKLERIKSNSSKPVIDKPDLVRTISKMEMDLARQLNPLLANDLVFTPAIVSQKSFPECTTPTTQAMDILSGLCLTSEREGVNVSLSSDTMFDYSPLTPGESEEFDLPTTSSFGSPGQSTNPRRELSKPALVTKRNTCGTIHVGTTLAAPDQDAMIKCVCGVFRAHLLQSSAAASLPTAAAAAADRNASAYLSAPPQDSKFAVFKDCRPHGDYRSLDIQSIPTLEAVTDFYRSIFVRSQMETECIIISLIYVERLIKKTKGELRPQSDNWRSILFSCMVLASKVWDDLSMWNCDFSKIGPCGMTFSLQRTNELEIALLSALQYRVKVGASEYAKYYFLLRGMLCRSGLASDDLTRLNPLDVQGATNISSTSGSSGRKLIKRRSKSFSEYSSREESERVGTERRGVSISLEELVPM